MFGKKKTKQDEIKKINVHEKEFVKTVSAKQTNTILKGSKLIGDIIINYDLDLNGEVEGNITSEEDSNIVIKGTCNGNIETKGGNVEIEGEFINGDIIAGGDIKINGRFNGETVKAKGKIYVNGEFKGKLESNEIEIGPNAKGRGELLYSEYISISKGAEIEAQITKVQKEITPTKQPADTKVVNIEPPAIMNKEISGTS